MRVERTSGIGGIVVKRQCDDDTTIFKLEKYGYEVWFYIVKYKAVSKGWKQCTQG